MKYIRLLILIVVIIFFNFLKEKYNFDSKIFYSIYTFSILVIILYKNSEIKNKEISLKKMRKYIIYTILSMIISQLLILILKIELKDITNQENVISFINNKGIYISFLTVVINAPLIEEFIFKNIVFDFFKNRKIALIFTSIIFSLLHSRLNLSIFLIYYINQFIYTYVYYIEKNIKYSIYLHLFNNLIGLILIIMKGVM